MGAPRPFAGKLWDGGDAAVRGFGIGAEGEGSDLGEEDGVFRDLFSGHGGWREGEKRDERGVEEGKDVHFNVCFKSYRGLICLCK
jgi:hypothetical protein